MDMQEYPNELNRFIQGDHCLVFANKSCYRTHEGYIESAGSYDAASSDHFCELKKARGRASSRSIVGGWFTRVETKRLKGSRILRSGEGSSNACCLVAAGNQTWWRQSALLLCTYFIGTGVTFSYTFLKAMTRIKIALVQYDPHFRDLQGNMSRVDRMIERLTPEVVDILLLPEMAFTGYMFAGRDEIEPFLESEDGPSIVWAQRTARRLKCAVILGYPELDKATRKAFNSIAVIDDTGHLQVSQIQSCLALRSSSLLQNHPDNLQKALPL